MEEGACEFEECGRMTLTLASTFTAALARLPSQDQKAVKMTVFDLQTDPNLPGLSMHRIDKARDPDFWSVRVNRDIRIVIHKRGGSTLVTYVDHHDDAYAWAMRRRIEAHPTTGALQIVEVRETVIEIAAPKSEALPTRKTLFAKLDPDALLSVGVPEDWVADVLAADEDHFFTLSQHLPAEAAEALLEYAATGQLTRPVVPSPDVTPIAHPDALRRFRTLESREEVQAALDAPWDTWSVFLHPTQRAVVERIYSGPARVAGSAGTGKTVVALHRAARILRAEPNARVLLSTFSTPLANALAGKMRVLLGGDHPSLSGIAPRLCVMSFEDAASDLFQLAFARKPRLATVGRVSDALEATAQSLGVTGYSPKFLLAEFSAVVDAWAVADLDAYANVPRLGRKARLGTRQREALWPVFEGTRAALKADGFVTWPAVFHALADHYSTRQDKPFTHVIIDEAQDLGVSELRFMTRIAASGPDALFFAGDLGQRIFQPPFSWKALGADVRGRSVTLRVNYRTSHQIRRAADSLLPGLVRDGDGREEDRRGTVSVFDGPAPDIRLLADIAAEVGEVTSTLKRWISDGFGVGEIGIFVRSRAELPRALAAIQAAGVSGFELTGREDANSSSVAYGTMHLAKGLEFRGVIVMACDDGILPLQERVDNVVDEADLDEVYETERHLLYVACTRARDRLLVTGVSPGSEFLGDLRG
jgi:hypothetical protein